MAEKAHDHGLFAFAPDAILVVAEDGRILRLNPMAERMFGYAQAELIGEPIERLVPTRLHTPHRALRAGYAGAPRPRQMGSGRELVALRKDGSEFSAEVALGPQAEDGERVVLCIVRDVSDRKETEAALRQARDELERRVSERTQELSLANATLRDYADHLERSNRDLQDFAVVASHDLREPLRKIQAFGERLQAQALDAKSQDYVSRMQSASARLQRFIDEMLLFAKVSASAVPFSRVDLARIAAEVVSDLEIAIEDAHATVTLKGLIPIDADPTQMRQLLQNLLGNGLKFHDKQRAHVVAVSGLVRDGCFELSVEDNGIGFDNKDAERIFGLFQRLHSRAEFPGSGVGLAICRKIVERHGGHIRADGVPGVGARFVVALPINERTTPP